MSDKKQKSCYANVGGQALMDGIMMRAADMKKSAFVVRLPDGGLFVERSDIRQLKDRHKFFGIPVVRGIVSFVESMIDGYKALSRSIDLTMPDDGAELTQKQKKREEAATGAAVVFGTVLGLCLAIVMMVLLPTWLTGLVDEYLFELSGGWRAVIEGVLKVIIFLAYISLCTLNKDVKRVFMYHGAEHKTIFCYENQLPLTVENVRAQKRFHPRCGTSFIIIMIGVSVLASAFIPSQYVAVAEGASNLPNILIRSALKILTLPLVMGLGYELLKLCGKYDNVFTRVIAAPGLWFQRITTVEPDSDGIIEVGIASLQSALGLEITVPTQGKKATPEQSGEQAAERNDKEQGDGQAAAQTAQQTDGNKPSDGAQN